MHEERIRNVVIHKMHSAPEPAPAERASEFHVRVIERSLARSALTKEQKIKVVEQIIENVKASTTQSPFAWWREPPVAGDEAIR